MRIIGLTGGIGTGKSTILRIMEKECGAYVVETDKLAHQLMRQGEMAYQRILEHFGTGILDDQKEIDRAKLGSLVFADEKELQSLNQIVHPAVKEYILADIDSKKKEGKVAFYVIEAALLIEDGYKEICDELWYIYADEETRMERLKQNRGYSEEKCRSIFRNQLSEEEFSDHCDFEIDNSDDFEKTKEQIQQKMQRMQIDEVM